MLRVGAVENRFADIEHAWIRRSLHGDFRSNPCRVTDRDGYAWWPHEPQPPPVAQLPQPVGFEQLPWSAQPACFTPLPLGSS